MTHLIPQTAATEADMLVIASTQVEGEIFAMAHFDGREGTLELRMNGGEKFTYTIGFKFLRIGNGRTYDFAGVYNSRQIVSRYDSERDGVVSMRVDRILRGAEFLVVESLLDGAISVAKQAGVFSRLATASKHFSQT